MQMLRQIGGSLLLAILSVALVIGGISLALAESYVPEIPPTPTVTPSIVPILYSPSPIPQLPVTATPTQFLPTNTVPPPTTCPPPPGWIPITVQPGETLATLALRYQVAPTYLTAANCLFSNNLPTGSIIYVPPVPTKTSIPCGPPAGWIRYTVRPGNTLYSLSQAYGVSISQLQFANCMSPNQYYLASGQSIWVPNVPTRTPRVTATPTLTPVSIIFPTLTRTATVTSSPTVTPTPTNVPTSTPTPTNVPSATATATVPSPTTPPTATATVTAFPSSTPTTPAP